MNTQKLCARDIIAVITIIGGMILVACHIDGIIGGLLVTIVAYYFGLNTPMPKEQCDGKSNTNPNTP